MTYKCAICENEIHEHPTISRLEVRGQVIVLLTHKECNPMEYCIDKRKSRGLNTQE